MFRHVLCLQLGVTRTAVSCGINLQLHPGTTEAYNVAGEAGSSSALP